jgi:hypothetical protein
MGPDFPAVSISTEILVLPFAGTLSPSGVATVQPQDDLALRMLTVDVELLTILYA